MSKRSPKNKPKEYPEDICFGKHYDALSIECTGIRFEGGKQEIIHYGCACQNICNTICHTENKKAGIAKIKEEKGKFLNEIDFDKIQKEKVLAYLHKRRVTDVAVVLNAFCKDLEVEKAKKRQVVYLYLMTFLLENNFVVIENQIIYNG